MRSSLIWGTTVLAHDHVYWGYPVFQFYAESLLSGRLPLWNPFTHGGEPFYPLLFQIRLLDLSSLLVVLLGGTVTHDLVVLYNWDRVVRSLILILGVYLLLRPWTRHRLTRLALIAVLSFSSFHWSAMRQMAIADQFIFAPYVGIFLFRILAGDARWRNWVALAGFSGLNWQSYFFTGTSLFILFVLLGSLLFRRDLLGNLLRTPQLAAKVAVAAVLVAALCLPNVSLLDEWNRYVFPARMVDHPYTGEPPQGGPVQYESSGTSKRFTLLGMPYGLVYHTGSFSSVWDFIQVLGPFANLKTAEGQRDSPGLTHRTWGFPSEAFMYIGMLPYCLALLGLLAGSHPLKRVWLVVGVGFGLVMLGPEAGLHALLFWLFPPVWFMRHGHALSLFFSTALLYLFALGADRLLDRASAPLLPDRSRSNPLRQRLIGAVILGGALAGAGLVMGNLQFPFSFYQIPIIALMAGAVWLGRRELGDRWLFWILILGHLAVIVLASRFFYKDPGFLLFVVLFLVVPVAAWLYSLKLLSPRTFLAGTLGGLLWAGISAAHLFFRGKLVPFPAEAAVFGAAGHLLAAALIVLVLGRRVPDKTIPVLLFVLLILDLSYYSDYLSHLLQWRRPDSFLHYPASLQPPRFPETRRVFPDYPVASPYQQPIRYLCVLYREPAAFTPLLEKQDRRLRNPADTPREIFLAIEKKRLNSFIMLKGYFDLITVRSSVHAIEETFAIGHPLIQFKEGFDALTDEQALNLLEREQTWSLIGWLQRNVVLSRPPRGLPLAVERVPFEARPESALARAVSRSVRRFDWKVEGYDYNSLRLRVRAEVPGLLYWADGYDPDWRAFIDGRKVWVYRANLNFKAVALPEGAHEVRFEYFPRNFLVAAAVFYAIQIGLGLWGLAMLVASAGAKLAPRPEKEHLEQDQHLRDVQHR